MLGDNLQTCIDVQKWEFATLLQDIYEKENQKYRVTYVCYSVFAVLAGLVSAITITLVKDAPRNDPLIYILLSIVGFGATAINVTAMRYITSLKREVFLVMRQLNCIRQSLQCLMHLLIEGKSPGQDFIKMKGRQNGESFNPYFELFGRHIKLPLDNEALRGTYYQKGSNGEYRFKFLLLQICFQSSPYSLLL